MTVSVVAVSDDPFGRSLLLAIMPVDRYATSLVGTGEEALGLLGVGPTEILLMTAQTAARLGPAFFTAATAKRGGPPMLLLLSRRTVQREAAQHTPHQVVLGYPCTREQLRDALGEMARVPKGVVAVAAPQPPPSPPPPSEPAAAEPDPTQARRVRVDAVFRDLPSLNHYALLGVDPAAPVDEIVARYQQRIGEFHPDRYVDADDALLQEQVAIISKRINAALVTLTRQDSRAAYDKMLAGSATDLATVESWTRDVQTVAGRRYVDLAQHAQAAGDLDAVRSYLALAMRMHASLSNSTAIRLDSLRDFLQVKKD